MEIKSFLLRASASWTSKYMNKEYGRNGKELVKYYFEDHEGFLKEVSPIVYKKSSLPDKTKEGFKEWYIKFLPTKISQFNKKVEYNSWLKSGTRSFEEQLEKLASMGVST